MIPHLSSEFNLTCDVERYEVTRRASPQVPAGFLCDRWSGGSRSAGATAAVVTTPAQQGAIRAAGGRGGRRVGHRPQSKDRGGGLIVVELFGRRLEERGDQLC